MMIRRTSLLAVPADLAWRYVEDPAGLRDIVPTKVDACRMEGNQRVVSLHDGPTVREQIVSVDATNRRIAYSATGGRADYHHAAMEIEMITPGTSRLIWTTDVLPDEMAQPVARLMESWLSEIEQSLTERAGPPSAAADRSKSTEGVDDE